MATVGLSQLARVLNLTEQRVNQLVAREGMPRVARGQYDLARAMSWYIKFLQRALGETDTSPARELTRVRTRAASAKAEYVHRENIKARSEVVLTSEFREQALQAIEFLSQALAPVAARVTDNPVLREKIDDELRLARNGFASCLESLTKPPAAK